MVTVEPELNRCLTLVRNKIRERGFTQLQVQEALGWGRSYISQLLTKQKALRVEQVLLILSVIGVDPAEFFGELFRMRAPAGVYAPPPPGAGAAQLRRELEGLRAMVQGLADLLLRESLITAEDLSAAVGSVSRDDRPGE